MGTYAPYELIPIIPLHPVWSFGHDRTRRPPPPLSAPRPQFEADEAKPIRRARSPSSCFGGGVLGVGVGCQGPVRRTPTPGTWHPIPASVFAHHRHDGAANGDVSAADDDRPHGLVGRLQAHLPALLAVEALHGGFAIDHGDYGLAVFRRRPLLAPD